MAWVLRWWKASPMESSAETALPPEPQAAAASLAALITMASPSSAAVASSAPAVRASPMRPRQMAALRRR